MTELLYPRKTACWKRQYRRKTRTEHRKPVTHHSAGKVSLGLKLGKQTRQIRMHHCPQTELRTCATSHTRVLKQIRHEVLITSFYMSWWHLGRGFRNTQTFAAALNTHTVFYEELDTFTLPSTFPQAAAKRLSPAPAGFKEARAGQILGKLASAKFLILSEEFCTPQGDMEDSLLYHLKGKSPGLCDKLQHWWSFR